MPNSEELNTNGFNDQDKGALDLSSPPDAMEAGFADDTPGVYGALKCYFYTPKRGDIWGSFCFLFNGATGESMENVFWVTRALVGPAIDVNMPWKTLNKLIPQMGNYEKSLGEKLSVMMLEIFTSGLRVELCRSDNPSEQLEGIEGDIRNGFERATHCFLDLKLEFERMSKQDLADAGVLTKEMKGNAPSEPGKDKTESEEKSFSGTLINCLPVIDPVHGKPVSELQPDDMVEVKIQGGIGASGMIHKYLTSTNQDAIFPIDSIEKGDAEKTYILLKINDEVRGIITVTKDIRLRVLRMSSEKKSSITFNLDNVIFFGILAASAVVIALVVKFLIF